MLLPIMVFMENVQGLSKADRAQVVQELEQLGYIVATITSDLRWHGVPCRRVRVWLLACLMPGASDEEKARTQAAAERALRLFLSDARLACPLF